MSSDCIFETSTSIDPRELRIPKARVLALLARSGCSPYVELLDCIASGSSPEEAIVLRLSVEVGQRPVNDIRRAEDVAVVFDPEDRLRPEVLALRRDFPQVPHLNLRPCAYPRSLCLDAEPYEEARIRWTPSAFLARLAGWLRDTAEGTLHRQDQALEPLLPEATTRAILLDTTVLDPANLTRIVPASLEPIQTDPRFQTSVLAVSTDARSANCVLVCIGTQPRTHGVIHSSPRNFRELHDFFASSGGDLLAEWKDGLAHSMDALSQDRQFLEKAQVVLLLVLPKKRATEGEVVDLDFRAFVCDVPNVYEIGTRLGVWVNSGGSLGRVLQPAQGADGTEIGITPMACMFPVDLAQLRMLSDAGPAPEAPLVCVGAGALGSHTLVNLARMGYGSWTLVDRDVLLPHNVARHVLSTKHVGTWKATSLADVMNAILHSSTAVRPIPADILDPQGFADDLTEALAHAGALVDMSTSVAVSRHLANSESTTPRSLSVFLNPAGTDLILLAQDSAGSVPLDSLEMQYYRHLVSNPQRYGQHLYLPGEGIRYGNTCRDITSRIPQDAVATLAGIASRAVRATLQRPDARIAIWQGDAEQLTTASDEVQVFPLDIKAAAGKWRIVMDAYVTARARDLRSQQLPNETGGIVIGSFDLQRNILYIVDVLPAPPDSVATPTSFVRGKEGVDEMRQQINDLSAGWLDYIGEWHSHPPGHTANRSERDCRQCTWIASNMHIEGLPGLMVIVGDDDHQVFLEYLADE